MLDEDGSDETGVVWSEARRPVGSTLVYAEGRAALALARRTRRLTSRYEQVVGSFEALYESIEAIDPSRELILLAGGLAETFALRGYDAVHLASALAALDESEILVTWDEDLGGAARQAGLSVVGAAA